MDLNMKIRIQQDTIKQLNDEKEALRKANEDLALQLEHERMDKKELLDAASNAKKFYEEKLVELSRLSQDYEKVNTEMRQLMSTYKKHMLLFRSQFNEDKI